MYKKTHGRGDSRICAGVTQDNDQMGKQKGRGCLGPLPCGRCGGKQRHAGGPAKGGGHLRLRPDVNSHREKGQVQALWLKPKCRNNETE